MIQTWPALRRSASTTGAGAPGRQHRLRDVRYQANGAGLGRDHRGGNRTTESLRVIKAHRLERGRLINRYNRELYGIKMWSPSKTRDLRTLKKVLSGNLVSTLNHVRIVEVFTAMYANANAKNDAGGTVVGARIGYMIKVMEAAANLWHLNVPLEAIRSARSALKEAEMISIQGCVVAGLPMRKSAPLSRTWPRCNRTCRCAT